MGKGAALKTAFRYILGNMPDAEGAVTADSDGQHLPEDIKAVMDEVHKDKDVLILGVRDFDKAGVPWKSRTGNKITKTVMSFLCGVKVSDTQTGLRGIPVGLIKELINVKYDRFEFETEMLVIAVKDYKLKEVKISTVYDSAVSHQTHFNAWKDSFSIYRILFGTFFKYIFVSVSSFAIDILLFSLACVILKKACPETYIMISTAVARAISSVYNFLMNKKKVFTSESPIGNSACRYFLLAFIQLWLSAFFVTGISNMARNVPETVIKTGVDTVLFFVNYTLQRTWVF